MLLLASNYLNFAVNAHCRDLNCSPSVLHERYHEWALPAEPSTEPFLTEFAAAMEAHPGCDAIATSDGWFRTHADMLNGTFIPSRIPVSLLATELGYTQHGAMLCSSAPRSSALSPLEGLGTVATSYLALFSSVTS